MNNLAPMVTSEQMSQFLGLGKDVLKNWRCTDVGPPYFKLGRGRSARVRYSIDEVIEWQKSCQRVVPENWQPTGSLPGENMPTASDRIQWLLIGQVAATIGLAIPTLTAWRKRGIGLPFIWIGGRGAHPFMYDRRDLDVFITRRKADPSVVPVLVPKPICYKSPETREERKRILAEIWKGMGHSDDEIRRMR